MSKLRLIVLSLLMLLASVGALAQDTRKQEARKARLEKEMAVLDKQLSENKSKSRNALADLSLIQKKVSVRKELLAESEAQIATIDRQIGSKTKEIAQLENRLDTLSARYSRLVTAAYRNRDAKVWYMYIIASDNLGQAFRRYGYFHNLSASMKQQATEIRETQSRLEEEKAALKTLRSDADQLRQQRKGEVNALAKEEKECSAIIASLKKDRSKYEKELASKQKQVDALNREIDKIIREAMQAKNGGGKKPKKPVDYTLSNEFSGNKGKLPWPADGPVTDKFGTRTHPVFTTVRYTSNGIDISLRPDTGVKAVFNGVVSKIVVMPGYNQCVLVQHGSYFTFYCKLKSSNVKVGDKVKTGQQIGVVDTINDETKLHFQLWNGTTPQNPETWLRPRD